MVDLVDKGSSPSEPAQAEDGSRRGSRPNPIGAATVLLVVASCLLLCISVISTRWIKVDRFDEWSGFVTGDAAAPRIYQGCFVGIALFLVLAFFRRWSLYVAQLFAFATLFAIAHWSLSTDYLYIGPALTLALVSTALLAAGITYTLASTSPSRSGRRESGKSVNGLKHGRWHIYDAGGACIAIEEWEHGKLLASKAIPEKDASTR